MNSSTPDLTNPFRPGAGHMPPYLAGREEEEEELRRLLRQETILENMVLTGLRGVGKTVLLDTFKPLAMEAGWLWVGTDLSESSSISEESFATRLLTDLSLVTSSLVVEHHTLQPVGFTSEATEVAVTLTFSTLAELFSGTPGLVADKVKRVLEVVAEALARQGRRGLIFAYDEAQNLSDHADKGQFPLSLLLDCFQSIQRKGVPFMLVLAGLPTLFPKLVDARTFAERMFRVVFLRRLGRDESREAILRPLAATEGGVPFDDATVETIIDLSGGYPYFIQFVCREVYDLFLQQRDSGQPLAVPVEAIQRKLDTDFFAGRWARATDRQRALLKVVAQLPHCDGEFTVQEVVARSREVLDKPFSPSHANQMLATLSEAGLIYKNRHGKYSFAVPLLGDFIRRQVAEGG